jgi:hypothetical protein
MGLVDINTNAALYVQSAVPVSASARDVLIGQPSRSWGDRDMVLAYAAGAAGTTSAPVDPYTGDPVQQAAENIT